jgi:hypothetical protein
MLFSSQGARSRALFYTPNDGTYMNYLMNEIYDLFLKFYNQTCIRDYHHLSAPVLDGCGNGKTWECAQSHSSHRDSHSMLHDVAL